MRRFFHILTTTLLAAGLLASSLAATTSGVVIIDPGHGGKDPGTQRGKLKEKAITLAIARLVSQDLRKHGVTTLLTRASDKSVSLQHRVDLANAHNSRLYLSIHCDSNPIPSEQGYSILISPHSAALASRASTRISRQLAATGIHRHALREDDRGLMVLHRTNAPAILIEVGFLSNTSDAAHLASPAYQQQLAHALARGVVEYLAAR